MDNFIKYINDQGLKVKLSNNFYAVNKYKFVAGSPEERVNDINLMFSDKKIKAIWCLQGGDTANQILDLIDFDIIKENPKLFMGKSDVDVLLLALNKKTELITIHCCDPKIGRDRELDFDYTKKWFKKRLFEKSKKIEASEEWTCINEGEAEGKILGCSLSSILKLAGTEYFPDFSNSILFIEIYKGNLKGIIWKLTQLEQNGVLDKINGIVVGNNFEFQDNKFKVEEIVKELLEKYNLPILKVNEFGHYQPHAFLPIGAKIKMDATNKKLEILDDFLE